MAPVPGDLQDRRVEITGPVERKMMINALNSKARAFMADFEDSCAPTWENVVRGQQNLKDAVDRTIGFTDPASGKQYRLNDRTATLIVRPRGWHLPEKHVQGGRGDRLRLAVRLCRLSRQQPRIAWPATAPARISTFPRWRVTWRPASGTTCSMPPRTGSAWPRGTIKATVLIETILAAFEMDEILYELREHSAGLNCGRWDYIFSFIKKFRNRADFVLPDRGHVTMDRHFLKSYVDLLISTCHRRGAHAMGGMAAQIPIKNDPEANAAAMTRVRADKLREAHAGHDGTWIAHPGLAEIALEAFDSVMTGPNQLQRAARRCVRDGGGPPAGPGGRHHRRRAAPQHPGRRPVRGGVARRPRLRAPLQPHGGCGHGGDLPGPDLAVGPPRGPHGGWPADHGRTLRRHAARGAAGDRRQRSVPGGTQPDSSTAAAALFGDMIRKPDFDEFLTLPAYERLA